MAKRIVALIMATLGSWLAVVSIQDVPLRWSCFAAFVVLGVGMLALEQISDNSREKREEMLQAEMRQRVENVHLRLAAIVASGSLKDRTIRLALELQNYALDSDGEAQGRTHSREYLARAYATYKIRFGSRVAEIERELGAAGVMSGSIEDYVLATVVPEDAPITSDEMDTEEWRKRPRSVAGIAEFLWERAAEL